MIVYVAVSRGNTTDWEDILCKGSTTAAEGHATEAIGIAIHLSYIGGAKLWSIRVCIAVDKSTAVQLFVSKKQNEHITLQSR